MPDLAELDRAVDALLDAPLLTPTDATVVMARGRSRTRRRRGAGLAAVATTVALVGAAIVITRPTRGAEVHIKTRDEPTSTVPPIEHLSPDGQFIATVLPDGVRLHETIVTPNALALLPHVQSDYTDPSAVRLIVWSAPLDGPQPPGVQFASTYRDLGRDQPTTIDGRPAVFVTDAPEAASHPGQVFLFWFVNDRSVATLIGLNGTRPDQLERVARGLRPPSVSQPPGIYVVRGGVLVKQEPASH